MANKISQENLNDIVEVLKNTGFKLFNPEVEPFQWTIENTKKSNFNKLKEDILNIFDDSPEIKSLITNIKNVSEILPIVNNNLEDESVSIEEAIKRTQTRETKVSYNEEDFKRSGITRF